MTDGEITSTSWIYWGQNLEQCFVVKQIQFILHETEYIII